MKITSHYRFRLFLICAIALDWSVAAYAEDKTEEWKKALPGKWHYHEKDEKVEADGVTIIKADGTFKGSGTIKANARTIELTVERTWEIKDDKIVEIVTKCNIPQYPVPKTTTDTIHSIDAKEFKYKSGETGKEITEARVEE